MNVLSVQGPRPWAETSEGCSQLPMPPPPLMGVPRLIDGGDVLDAQLLINGLSSEGVWYLATASCSSGVLRWVRVNPGGTLSASVGYRVSGCLDGSWSLPAMPAHDGVVKLRSLVS